MSAARDRILEEVGWMVARREMKDALAVHGIDLAADWLDRMTATAIEYADAGRLPFDVVAAGLALAAKRWWK